MTHTHTDTRTHGNWKVGQYSAEAESAIICSDNSQRSYGEDADEVGQDAVANKEMGLPASHNVGVPPVQLIWHLPAMRSKLGRLPCLI